MMQSSIMLPKLTETSQTISFSEGDGVCSAEVYATDVVVTTNAGSHNHGSSKVKLKNLVDYNWEPKFYPGQLLATHISGKYLAYSIKAPKAVNPGSWNGMVRVVHNPEPGTDRRALIKGMKGEIQDLAFAHLQDQVILACIDDQGNFYVHEIDATDSGLRCTLLAEVNEDTNAGGNHHRVMWCPYIPDDEDADEDVARLLLTTHAQSARMWNMSMVCSHVCVERRATASALLAQGSVLVANEHTAHIVDAAFSPDGTALATASADGRVMFFQVYMHKEGGPRCLHKWQPHGGKPLSCLFFLDDHKHYNTDVQFWKFAVTGTDNNATIKIWSCKSWSCIQTITFTPDPTEGASFGFKVMVDTSAKYLLLSDFKSRSLYVMQMARNSDDTLTYCKTISEFLLPYPVLSFCIADAEEEQVKCDSSSEEAYHQNGSNGDAPTPDEFDTDEENGAAEWCRVKLRLYIVQPKGLQEGTLVYKHSPVHQNLIPELEDLALEDKTADGATAAIASSILQQQSQQLKNLLMRSQTQPGSLISQRPESPPAIAPQLNLMTPDAFSSPGKREEDDPPLSATPDVAGLARSSTGGVPLEVSISAEAKLTSGGSSPSREVQEIMSHSDTTYYKEEEVNEIPLAVKPEMVEEDAVEEELYNDNDVFPPESPEPVVPEPTSESSWPQISMAQITEANQRKASDSLTRALPQTCACADSSSVLLARLSGLQDHLEKLTEAMMVTNTEVLSLKKLVEEGKSSIDSAISTNAHWERLSEIGLACGRAAATAAGAGAARALEPLAGALQRDLAASLARTDLALRDSLRTLVTSKTLSDKLSTAIAKSLSEMVREHFKEVLVSNVAPLVEKAHAQLFRQLSQAYQAGTKELASNTEAMARQAVERGASSVAQNLCNALETHADVLAKHSQTYDQRVLQELIRETTHGVLEKELNWWREQARGALQSSRAHSPAASTLTQADRQMQMAQIQSLVTAGDYNGAFQLALSASDLSLVAGVCRAAEPSLVARLKPHVLLSLLQQLANDLPRDAALKHRYLEEAIFNLDPSNPIMREHLPIVIRDLQKQIVSFLNANPGHACYRQYKMLLMATESLVKNSV